MAVSVRHPGPVESEWHLNFPLEAVIFRLPGSNVNKWKPQCYPEWKDPLPSSHPLSFIVLSGALGGLWGVVEVCPLLR